LIVFLFIGLGTVIFLNPHQIRHNEDWAPLPSNQVVGQDEHYKYFISHNAFGRGDICYHIQSPEIRCLGQGLAGVDINTFEVHKKYYNFSKDKTHLFYASFDGDEISAVDNVDFASLQILNKYAFKDKNKVYFWDIMSGHFTSFSGFDLNSLVGLSDTIIKDKNGIYIRKYDDYYNDGNFTKLTNLDIDVESFTVKSDYIATDKNNVFLLTAGINPTDYPHITKVDRADPNSFQIIEVAGVHEDGTGGIFWKDYMFGKDTLSVYYRNQKIEGADPMTFSPYQFFCHCTLGREPFLLQEYSKDAQNVFYKNMKIPEADLDSFEVLGYGTAKDKNHVYSGSEIMEGVDPKTYVYQIEHD